MQIFLAINETFILPSSAQDPASAELSLALFSLHPHYVAEAAVYVAKAQNTVNRANTWLKLVSVVIDNICAVRILYRDLSDSPFSLTI